MDNLKREKEPRENVRRQSSQFTIWGMLYIVTGGLGLNNPFLIVDPYFL